MEPQSAPWRVFDAPTDALGSEPGVPVPPGQTADGGAAAAVNARLAIAGVVGAVVIAGLAVIVAISGAGAGSVEGPVAPLGAGAASDQPPGGEIVVDVAGAVVKPGVYRLPTGARIGDAIDAAGGFSPRVDVNRVGSELNLAAALSDGAQIRVPSRDDSPPNPGGGGGGGSGNQLVNLNTATESELDTLPGIGPVTAGKIIESRAGAPFRTIDELRERGIVGEKTFETLKPLITVG